MSDDARALSLRLTDPSATPEELYEAIHDLGHRGSREYAGLVEPFLRLSEQPMVARVALEVLDGWGLGAVYRNEILQFTNGVNWDLTSGGYVRLVAAIAAGKLIAKVPDAELTAALLALAQDDAADMVARDVAYAGLLLGEGVPMRDLPSAARIQGPGTYDPAVLRRAAARSRGS